MFAEVYKKDSSLQDEEYAECYAFEKTMLLSKNELETYSSNYEENLIKNFHQKQSSYAQSEGYHSYVSSNDSAITAPFSDSRSQTETDFVVPTDENICSQKQHFHAGSTNSFRLAADTTKWRNSFNSCCAFKNSVNYEKCNSQHIVHSARVQTPQRHHSETVLYLNEGVNKPAAKQQQQFSKEIVQNHNPVNSQLRKLYPVSTYTVQPHVQAEALTMCNEFASLHSSKSLASKTIFDAECRQSEQNQHHAATADYTFLDPSKKRIISNQNLKVIQKQALISYYERHHSTWRSEPQLSSNLSSVKPHPRPRLPTPTSCHLTSSSDTEESFGVNHSNTCTFKNEDCNEPAPTDVSLSTNTRFCSPSPIITNTLLTVGDDRVPELPPKKAHLRIAVATRCSSSPELPLPPPPSPPPPPPSMLEEEFAPDEPFPPPPVEAVLICDMPKQLHRELTDQRDTSSSNVVVSNASTTTSRQTLPHNDSQHSTEEFGSRTQNTMCNVATNSVRLSSTSFRSYVKPTRNEAKFADAVLWSDPLIEKAQTNDRYNFQHPKDEQSAHGLAKSTRNNEGNQIEQKVKAIRTLFEDKFRKSMNTKSFQFPSFSFMHSEKFPSRLDPRFPRTSYHLSQTNHQRQIRDNEKVGIYKRTASPSARNDESHHTAVAEADQTLSSESVLLTYSEPFTEFFRYTSATSATSVQTTVHSQAKHQSDSCLLLPKFKNQNYFKSAESENDAKSFNERVAHLSQRSQSSLCDTIHKTSIASSSSASFHISRSHTSSPDERCSQKSSSSSSSSSSCSFNEHSTDGKASHHLGVVTVTPSRSAFPSACHKQRIEQNESFIDLNRSVMCAKSATIDAASQTEVDVIFEEKTSLANVCAEVDCASSSFSHHSALPINEMEEEIEQLRREVISYLAPTNRLYKILEPKSETKTSIDYLHNVFQTQIVQMKLFPKTFSSVSESEDTRLQEGSIKCRDGDELEVSHQTVQNENCDNFQILPCSVACPLQQKKRNLNKHLIQKLDKLKIEQNAVRRECLSNEELGDTISEKVLRFVTPREASKYKSYVKEIGQITSLLLGLGERLAKVENSLFDMPSDSYCNEKDVLQNKRDQLLRQLEDAKELKKNIDKRGYSLSSSLQKYLSESELEDYQRFIQTKCRLLIHSRSINDKIFDLQRLVNALKEDEIESNNNSPLQFIN